MIKNYLKVAWRNLRRNSLYSLINIGGLAIGMTVSFMLLIYVYNEFSFDKFNTNTDRLYRVLRNQPSNGELMTNGATPIPLAPAMIKDYPEIEKVARTNWPYDVLVNYKDKSLKVNTMAADPSVLEMFSFDFIRGSKKNAFNDISSIVLTESSAKSIFGDANPIGQVIKFNTLISWDQLAAQQSSLKTSGWGTYSFMTYAMLRPGTSQVNVNAKLKG